MPAAGAGLRWALRRLSGTKNKKRPEGRLVCGQFVGLRGPLPPPPSDDYAQSDDGGEDVYPCFIVLGRAVAGRQSVLHSRP
jgi:hypothetical protein